MNIRDVINNLEKEQQELIDYCEHKIKETPNAGINPMIELRDELGIKLVTIQSELEALDCIVIRNNKQEQKKKKRLFEEFCDERAFNVSTASEEVFCAIFYLFSEINKDLNVKSTDFKMLSETIGR